MKTARVFNGAVLGLISISLAVTVAHGWTNQPLFQDEQSRTRNLKARLGKSGSALIDSILNENAEGIAALWSESGVAIGIDGPVLSTSEIKTEFQTKSKSFCLFFNTDCLRTQAGFEQKYCYRDLLSKAETRNVSYKVGRDGKSLIGEMRVDLKGGPVEMSRTANPLEFDFLYEDGRWKLVSLPAI